jgi:hypothetical protein
MNVVVSAHLDTVYKDPMGTIENGTFEGPCDNIASILSCGLIMEDSDLTPNLIIELTNDEEMHMDGARYVAKDYKIDDTLIVVLDVTERGRNWDNTYFTVENWHGVDIKHIKKALKEFKGHYRLNKDGEESEAWLYRELGFAVLEIDVPVSGGVHNMKSKARVVDMQQVAKAVKAIAGYFYDKERSVISDIYKVGEP